MIRLPERVSDLSERVAEDARARFPDLDKLEAEDRAEGVLYMRDGAGFRLSRPALGVFEQYLVDAAQFQAEHEARMAELKADIANSHRQIIERDSIRALLAAGADRGLIDGAAALFRQQVPLRVDDEGSQLIVVADGAGSFAGVNFAASAWLDGPAGAPFRPGGRDRPGKGEGKFASQLKLVFSKT